MKLTVIKVIKKPTQPIMDICLATVGWAGWRWIKKHKNVAWFSFNVDRVPQFFKWIKQLVVKGIIDSLKF
ncbi:hypothetical protein [Acinetobacter indicus]|uniref:hypothetical protein n=1 Tax=Acinetobacter indicus TaxID=756892 RepID=UPI00144393AC|nr:hypothetical protein [Acinetobacter indicus]